MFTHRYSPQTSEKVLKALINSGKIDAKEIEPDIEAGMSWEDKLDQCISNNLISEEWMVSLLSKNAGVSRSFPEEKDIDPGAVSSLPTKILSQLSVLPYNYDEKILKILVLDPFYKGLNSTLRSNANRDIIIEITSLTHLKKLYELDLVAKEIQKLMGVSRGSPARPDHHLKAKDDAAPHTEKVVQEDVPRQEEEETNAEDEPPELKAEKVTEPKQPIKATKEFKFRDKWSPNDPDLVIKFCDQLLMDAVVNGASDIHIECFRESARVRMRKDGTMKVKANYGGYLFKNYASVIARLKILAECDISERRLPQDGAITIAGPNGQDIDFRFNVMPTKNGERIVMRILAGDAALSLDKLGFDAGDYQKIIDAITSPQGMVLVTGPTGSGKTTTLYGALQYINRPDINILTAEDPIEYYLEGAGQVQANEKIGLSFSNILRAFLRQDPEVILVGEIRDQETIDIAIKAALTGHLLLSTLHTNDAISTITRIQNMGVPNFMISSALSIVVAQRLAKKNCQNCLEDDPRATPENLKKIGFLAEEAAELKAQRGRGCKQCDGSGLKGRQGIYEVLRMTRELEDSIIKNVQASDMLKVARKDGFKTMQEIARDFIRKVILSIEEYQSALNLEH